MANNIPLMHTASNSAPYIELDSPFARKVKKAWTALMPEDNNTTDLPYVIKAFIEMTF